MFTNTPDEHFIIDLELGPRAPLVNAPRALTNSSSWSSLARADAFGKLAHFGDHGFLQRLARERAGVVAALREVPFHGQSPYRYRGESPGLGIPEDRGIRQEPVDLSALQQLLQGFRALQLKTNIEARALARSRIPDQLPGSVVPAGHNQRKVGKTLHPEAAPFQPRIIDPADEIDRLGKQMSVLERGIDRRIGYDRVLNSPRRSCPSAPDVNPSSRLSVIFG
jgi:hypothetical protein